MTQTLKFEHNGVQIHIDVKTDDVTEFQEARLTNDVTTLTYTNSYYNEVYNISLNMNVFDSTNWVDEFNSWKSKASNTLSSLHHQTNSKIAKKVKCVDVIIDENGDIYETFMLGDTKVTVYSIEKLEKYYKKRYAQYFKAVKGEQEIIIRRDDIPSDIEHPDRFDYYIQQILAM